MLCYKIEASSTLDLYEYSHLRATVEAYFNDKYNCYKCLRINPDGEGRAGERGRIKRQSKGCFDFTTRTILLDNIKYSSCVGNYSLQGFGYFIEIYLAYEKGRLPFGDSLGNQPNKIIEVLHIIDTIKKEKANESAEKEKIKAKNGRH